MIKPQPTPIGERVTKLKHILRTLLPQNPVEQRTPDVKDKSRIKEQLERKLTDKNDVKTRII